MVISSALSLAFASIAMIVRTQIASPFYISGSSMEPTFRHGQYVIAKKFNNDFSRGDVIVYRSPEDPKGFFVHRIVAVPGDEMSYKKEKIILKNNEFFVMGDSPLKSYDSRSFGPITREQIVGKISSTTN